MPEVRIAIERPILFSAMMVRSIMDRKKTQTRRAMYLDPWAISDWSPDFAKHRRTGETRKLVELCPYGRPGDSLWVREAWKADERTTDLVDGIRYRADDAFMPIEASHEAAERWAEAAHRKPRKRPEAGIGPAARKVRVETLARHEGWRPSIHMPRWASRILLRVEEVRAQRLADITREDVRAEGIPETFGEWVGGPRFPDMQPDEWDNMTWREQWARCWDSINAARGYPARLNPWVWAVTFAVEEVKARAADALPMEALG